MSPLNENQLATLYWVLIEAAHTHHQRDLEPDDMKREREELAELITLLNPRDWDLSPFREYGIIP